MENSKKAIVWGDSLAKGVLFDSNRNRYTLCQGSAVNIVSEKSGIEIINHAKMGSTVKDGIEIAKRDIETGISADYAIIEFGGNDCDFCWKEVSDAPDEKHLPKTEANTFEKDINELIRLAKENGMTPILINLPPINADKYFDFISSKGLSKENIIHWLGDKNHIYRYHERYSGIVNKVALYAKCKLIDVRSAFLGLWNSQNLLCEDGIHPNEEGQKFIANAIMSQI